ncbi:hypothetical protein GRJ2_000189300 [Grus japonensis]|uniref:Uncharacterized protein n=1 Tax=Grus japonensis TaxID=30415 RepID=A0ABC9VVX8_GRUJA
MQMGLKDWCTRRRQPGNSLDDPGDPSSILLCSPYDYATLLRRNFGEETQTPASVFPFTKPVRITYIGKLMLENLSLIIEKKRKEKKRKERREEKRREEKRREEKKRKEKKRKEKKRKEKKRKEKKRKEKKRKEKKEEKRREERREEKRREEKRRKEKKRKEKKRKEKKRKEKKRKEKKRKEKKRKEKKRKEKKRKEKKRKEKKRKEKRKEKEVLYVVTFKTALFTAPQKQGDGKWQSVLVHVLVTGRGNSQPESRSFLGSNSASLQL